jgi:hydroxymethylglutaryl-CoA lyase
MHIRGFDQNYSELMRIIEVGPRDGLQNEKNPIPTEIKRAFVKNLLASGLQEIEVTSFVSPKWVPQLADAVELLTELGPNPGFSCLVPNAKGLERAITTGVDRIALFTAASEAFTLKNINMTIADSMEGLREVIAEYRSVKPDGWIRGYVSTAFECPFAGRIGPEQVAKVSYELLKMGVDEVSLGDTIGVAVPHEVSRLIQEIADIPKEKVAWHFHDTRGTAIANVSVALEAGYAAFDSSAAGLGGCPYAPGAGGNLSTEDLVYFLERSGVATGIDPTALAQASLPILECLGRPPVARAQLASLAAFQPI